MTLYLGAVRYLAEFLVSQLSGELGKFDQQIPSYRFRKPVCPQPTCRLADT